MSPVPYENPRRQADRNIACCRRDSRSEARSNPSSISTKGNYSSTNWLILVDTNACTVAVYNGSRGSCAPLNEWICSPGAPWTPTVTGEFTVTGKGYSFGSGYMCYYYTQFYGDYLFHSVLYNQGTLTFRTFGSIALSRMCTHSNPGCQMDLRQHPLWNQSRYVLRADRPPQSIQTNQRRPRSHFGTRPPYLQPKRTD